MKSKVPFETETTMAGVLKRKGNKSSRIKKRHYILKGNVMYYYLKKESQQLRGLIYLPTKLMKFDFSKGKFGIKIYNHESTTEYQILYFSSKDECKEWYIKMMKAAGNDDVSLKYKMEETIGTGNFSTVRRGYLRKDKSQEVAIKIITKKHITEIERANLINELAVLRLINHPGIPKLYETYETPEKLFIITENIKDGELFDYLVKLEKLPFEEAKKH